MIYLRICFEEGLLRDLMCDVRENKSRAILRLDQLGCLFIAIGKHKGITVCGSRIKSLVWKVLSLRYTWDIPEETPSK